MVPQIIQKLFESIYQYYPVGCYGMHDKYIGREKARIIVETKINQVIAKEDVPWERFVLNLQERFGNKVFNLNYIQFPSYSACIEVSKESDPRFDYTCNIFVCVSLLAPYYTLYFEDNYTFESNEKFGKPYFRIFFLNNTNRKIISSSDVNLIKEKIQLHFPGYTFVPHNLLFDFKMDYGDITSHFGESKPTPLYAFLFNPILMENISILE